MGLFQKKVKEQPEPQYYMSAINIKTLNYKVYYMSVKEKILYFLLAFVVGAAVGYLFYGGLALDEFSQPTTLTYILNIVISSIAGIAAGKMFLPIRVEQIIKKRKKILTQQFRDMLDSLTTSLGAGNNMLDSLYSVREDLQMQYEEDAYMIQEINIMIAGAQTNFLIEDMLYDLGIRRGIDDIKSFAEVFKVAYRKGGNIRDIIQNTYTILNDKLEIQEEIETVVTSSKTEQNMMIVMPIVLIGMIKSMSPDFASNYATPAGIAATTVAIIIFVLAYKVGKEILNIKM